MSQQRADLELAWEAPSKLNLVFTVALGLAIINVGGALVLSSLGGAVLLIGGILLYFINFLLIYEAVDYQIRKWFVNCEIYQVDPEDTNQPEEENAPTTD